MYEKIMVLSIEILLMRVMVVMIGVIGGGYLKEKKGIFEGLGVGMLMGFMSDFGDRVGIGCFGRTRGAFGGRE